MDQSIGLTPGNRARAVERLADHIAGSILNAKAGDDPFGHLVFERVFPDDIYAAMMTAMPEAGDYRALEGRNQENVADDGRCTRVKIDLFPEYVRHLPAQKRPVWDIVGEALCSEPVLNALRTRLGPGLAKRFGPNYADIGMYPIPVLMRDIPGYKILPHPDTHWKGITAQFYLPKDESISHIGTIFNEPRPEGGFVNKTQMKFVPNSGYAFAVDKDTWHSADEIGPEVTTRDSIIITYFVDDGALRVARNRGKRVGNFLLNEMRGVASVFRR